ncbi:MAG: VOC family protein [Pseudomonadota bacterium]|nr:VOC family protein [Pseudomonadota bacterium]
MTPAAKLSQATLEPRLDHVIVSVRGEIDAARDTYSRLGFSLTERGHSSLGSSNHLAVFGETYLEIFGFEPGNDAVFPPLWTDPTGLIGIVFKGDDPDLIVSAISNAGFDSPAPMHHGRPVRTSAGEAEARFTTIGLPDDAIENGRSFFCCHHTPELVWRREDQSHANGAHEIVGFDISAPDPAATARVYGNLFGPSCLSRDGSAITFRAGATTVRIDTPAGMSARHGDAIEPWQDEDRMVALTFATHDLRGARQVLTKAGVSFLAPTPSRLVVPAKAACGVALIFIEGQAA